MNNRVFDSVEKVSEPQESDEIYIHAEAPPTPRALE